MLRIAGSVLVVIGSVGFAWSLCRESARRLFLLKQLRSMLESLQYYIAYQKATIPEALRKLAQKEESPWKSAFEEIYERIYEKGENFPPVWRACFGMALEKEPLSGEEKELLLDFPSNLGFMEENAQARALDELLREISLHIRELEEEKRSKNKMIMSFGMAAGVLLSILLL